MRLNRLVNGLIGAVNANLIGNVLTPAPPIIAPDGTATPSYTRITGVRMQVQSTTGADLKQVDSLNIQGIYRTLYIDMRLDGINRYAFKGGELLEIPTGLNSPLDTWYITQVLEAWEGWTKAFITLQKPEINP